MYNVNRYYSSGRHLTTKIQYFIRHGHRFSHFPEVNFTLYKFNNMTYKYYLKKQKSMLEWKKFEKLAKNPGLMSEIDETIYHPLTHAYDTIQNHI